MITLTIAEIKDLAECAGLILKNGCEPDKDDLETEITIIDCPKDGVKDDDDNPTQYAHIAYFDEYPEEGCYPLGESLCPKCKKPWIDHEFAVPAPYCP